MKKVIFVIVLFLSCYVIYNITEDNRVNYMALGDGISYGYKDLVSDYLFDSKRLGNYNDSFVDSSYRITDLINKIKYNDYVVLGNERVYINRVLKEADIITLSIGNNELYYKLSLDNVGIYEYIENMLSDIDILFKEINRYNHKLVFVTGFYNFFGGNSDLINYVNLKVKRMADEEGFVFIDISFLNDRYNFFDETQTIWPNMSGYNKIFQIILEKMKLY